MHKLLDVLDPDDPGDLESLARSYASDLGLRPVALQNAVEMTRGFYESPLAERVRAAKCVRREVPFCVRLGRLPAVGGRPDLAADVTVEGAADLLMEEDDGWRVVDFKTDKVDASEVPSRAAHYKLQGACYALCISSVIGVPVVEVVLYFLHPRVAHAFRADETLLGEARHALAEVRNRSHPARSMGDS